MWKTSEIVTVGSSLILRLSAFVFLRWIPGHHFPPIVLTALVCYLSNIYLCHGYLFSKSHREASDEKIVKGQEGTSSTTKALPSDESRTSTARASLYVIFGGVPRPLLKLLSFLTVSINIFLTVFTLDLVFRGPLLYPANDLRFSRVGFVDSTSARILFREPDSGKLPVTALYKTEDSSSWTTARVVEHVSEDTDFTYPILLLDLHPETTYQYNLSNDLTGEFTTAPASTSPSAESLTFVTSSCIKANFPYNPLSHALAIPGFKHLSYILSTLSSRAQFMLFLGDFIYVDVPLRLSSSTTHYRSEYRRVYDSPSWSLPNLQTLPWLHTLDDHEIANDWASGNVTAPYPSARDPFRNYHVSVNPPIPPASPEPHANITYFQFTRGPASFFMLDTRTYRTQPSGSTDSTILGALQLSALLSYLHTPEPEGVYWKFIASSVPFTRNWRFGAADTWAGFPVDRARVLEAMHFAERELGVRVVVLSGDRHEFGAIRFPPPRDQGHSESESDSDSDSSNPSTKTEKSTSPPSALLPGPHEFSVGPLSMFYLPIRTFRQVDEGDETIVYIPDGNSKVGSLEIAPVGEGEAEAKGRVRSRLRYTLWVDGERNWGYVLDSPPALVER